MESISRERKIVGKVEWENKENFVRDGELVTKERVNYKDFGSTRRSTSFSASLQTTKLKIHSYLGSPKISTIKSPQIRHPSPQIIINTCTSLSIKHKNKQHQRSHYFQIRNSKNIRSTHLRFQNHPSSNQFSQAIKKIVIEVPKNQIIMR